MIQRIQTLYLLASLIFVVLMFFMPEALLIDYKSTIYEFYLQGIKLIGAEGFEELSTTRNVPLVILFIAVSLINFISIFLYKNRILQMRLCIFNIILLLGSMLMILYYLRMYGTHLQVESSTYRVAFVFPLVSAILHFLAFRGIRKDELLVRSMDRIR